MKLFAAVLVLCVAFASAEFKDKTEDDFFKASAACVEKLKIPDELALKFQQFDYPDQENVHKYLQCVFSLLELWSDESGYNADHVAALYKDKAPAEELSQIVNNCNKNFAKEPALKRVYSEFLCIMSTKIGQWFKDDITKQAAASA